MFYGLDTIANIVSSPLSHIHLRLLMLHPQTVAGHPLAWVNNQFQQYVYDVTDYLASPADNDTTLTIAFESPITYGQNVSARADVEQEITIDVGTRLACGRRIYLIVSSSV